MAFRTVRQCRRRVGIVGYGSLGKYLVESIRNDPKCQEVLDLAFVWNRTGSVVSSDPNVPAHCRLEDLEDFQEFKPDLIVEVAHPSITKTFGKSFLESADYLIGSPTALADTDTESSVIAGAFSENRTGVFIPSGAMWGVQDIQKMADSGRLRELTITMKKPPSAFKVSGSVKERLDDAVASNAQGETVLYDGPVRGLCPLAPNNINTMAAAALAGHTLGLDGSRGVLISDPSLDEHIVEVDVVGPVPGGGGAVGAGEGSKPFRVLTTRVNPAAAGAVTGSATYASFVSSVLAAARYGAVTGGIPGVHFC